MTPKPTTKQNTQLLGQHTRNSKPTKTPDTLIKTKPITRPKTRTDPGTTLQTSPNPSTQKTPTNAATNYLCKICKEQVLDTDKAVSCDCDENTWFHTKCVDITDTQYDMLNDEEITLTWVCTDCKSLLKAPNPPKQSKQFDEIIKILLADISTLKDELSASKQENIRLSETIAKKMEVIEKMQSVIYDFATEKPSSSKDNPKSKTEEKENMREHNKTKTEEQDPTPRTLLIGDSLIRDAANILKTENKISPTTDTIVIPGGKISDLSKFLANQCTLPKKIIINFGSNNIRNSRTPNHVMRPLWLTVEANQKRSPKTEWLINSIPYREYCNKKFIDEVNKALQFMCKQLKTKFIDNTGKLKEDHLSWDGVHLTKEGSTVLAEIISTILEDTDEQPDTDPITHNAPNAQQPSDHQRM